MSAPPELKLLRSIKTGKGLIKLVNNLKLNRRINKIKGVKRSALTKKQRDVVLEKTDGHCHICGIKLGREWQADHVNPHSAGGVHAEK